jgi:hypothetical protein
LPRFNLKVEPARVLPLAGRQSRKSFLAVENMLGTPLVVSMPALSRAEGSNHERG